MKWICHLKWKSSLKNKTRRSAINLFPRFRKVATMCINPKFLKRQNTMRFSETTQNKHLKIMVRKIIWNSMSHFIKKWSRKNKSPKMKYKFKKSNKFFKMNIQKSHLNLNLKIFKNKTKFLTNLSLMNILIRNRK